MRRLSILSAVASLCVGAALGAQDLSPFLFPDARAVALGGSHAAVAKDIDDMLSNPASLAAIGTSFSAFSLSPRISGPVYDIANLLVQQSDVMSNLGGLFDSAGRLYTKVDLGGPLAVGYTGGGLGFLLCNRTQATINAASFLDIRMEASEDIFLIGGFAHRFALSGPLSLDFGLSCKGFARGSIPIETDILGLASLFSDPAGAFLDKSAFQLSTGIGLDAGFRLNAGDRFTWAVSATDAYSPTFTNSYASLNGFLTSPRSSLTSSAVYGLVPCDLSTGVWANLPLGTWTSGLQLMLDYRDILSLFAVPQPNPILLLGAGAELTIHDILKARVGLDEGLFSAGIGLDLTLFTLDMAMYGTELGLEPGQRPVYSLALALSVKK